MFHVQWFISKNTIFASFKINKKNRGAFPPDFKMEVYWHIKRVSNISISYYIGMDISILT